MGKLKELWQERKACTDPAAREEIEKEINGIEEWMIANKLGTIQEVTKWNQPTAGGFNDFDNRFNNPNYSSDATVIYVEDIVFE